MSRFRGLSLLLLLVAAPLRADDVVTETVFVPPVYFVGDLVEARLTLLLPEGKTVLPPLSLPEQSWVLIRDVQVRHDPPFERVTVKFVPFAPGTKTLPPLVLGDLTLDGVRVTTNSLLDKADTVLAPPRDQLLLPHTELVLFLAFLLLIVLPLLLWRFFAPLADLLGGVWRRADRRRAWRQLNKDWKRLQLKTLALEGPEFYTEFNHLVRQYLEAHFSQDFQSLTAAEAGALLQSLPEEWSAEWVRLLHRADVVRFDNRHPPHQERLDDMDALRREAEHLGKEAALADV